VTVSPGASAVVFATSVFAASVFALLGCGDDSGGGGSGGDGTGSTGTGSSGTGSRGTGASGSGGAVVGEPCEQAESYEGEATYYDFADGSGNCSFPATPDDLLVGAMNHADYADSAACGACARVVGPTGTVDVRIVDRCPECAPGDIDLSPEAFVSIAELSAGRVPISWQYIECPTEGPLVFHFKDGSNEWWTAVQVRNHNHAITSLDYLDDAGAFVNVPRLDYNYFVMESGMGPGPYTFRVTDVLGNAMEHAGIEHVEDGDVVGGGQFPVCSQ